jgi:hypothetical protein
MWRFFLGASFLLGAALALVPSPAAGAPAKKAGPKDGKVTTTTVVLYGKDAGGGPRAFAQAYNVDTKYVLAAAFSTKASRFPGLTTLSAWGHGNADMFCEMSSDKFVELILAWKQLNPELKTVEIFCCDARHNAKGEAQGPYAKRVAAGVRKKYRDLTIKALPIGQAKDDSSTLLVVVSPPTFCYITAPNKLILDRASAEVTKLGPTLKNDLSLVGNQLQKNLKRQYTINYGPLKNIRSELGVVK